MGGRDVTFTNFLSDLEHHAGPGKHGVGGAGNPVPRGGLCGDHQPPQWETKHPRLWDMQIIKEYPWVAFHQKGFVGSARQPGPGRVPWVWLTWDRQVQICPKLQLQTER